MKILVSDFDKTLFDENYIDNIKRVNEFVNKGNMFIIATGRSLRQLLKEIKRVNINYKYLICNDGGTIYDTEFNLIRRIDIDKSIDKKIFNILQNSEYITDSFIDTSQEYTKDLNKPVNAIIANYNDYEESIKILEMIEKKYPSVHGYLSDNWINITANNVTKDNAIDYLIKKLKLNEEDVVTVGDAINDISMIKKYDGFIMECSKEELKKEIKKRVNSLEELIDWIEYKEKKD